MHACMCSISQFIPISLFICTKPQGNYSLKLKRQDYFISKQDRVIKLLLEQQSRHQFVKTMFQKKMRELEKVHELLNGSMSLMEEVNLVPLSLL